MDAAYLASGSDRILALPIAQAERAAIHLAAPFVFERPARKPDGPHGKDLAGEAAQDKEPQGTTFHDPPAVLEIPACGRG